MNAFLKRLTEEAKPTEKETPAQPFAKDQTGYFATTRAVERPNPLIAMEPEDDGDVDAEHGEDPTDQDDSSNEAGGNASGLSEIKAEIERLRQENREILAGSHRAGQVDNQTILDAERYRALQREKPEQIDPEVEAVLKDMKPEFRKAFEVLVKQHARGIVEQDPEIKKALEKVNRLDQTNSTEMQRKLRAERDDLAKLVAISSIPLDVQEQVASLRLQPAFASKTLIDIYELVSGKKVRKNTAPRPEKVSSSRTAISRQPPTKNFEEGVRRAQQRLAAEG